MKPLPTWQRLFVEHLPLPVAWATLSLIYLSGAAIGSLAWDTYMEVRHRLEYRGKEGTERWTKRVKESR